MIRKYDKKGNPIPTARELKIERLIRRIKNSGVLFDPDEIKADKAFVLLGKCRDRLMDLRRAQNDKVMENYLPSWLTKADFM